MKKRYCLFLGCMLSLLSSCQKEPINGKLDGMWQLMKIEYKDKPSVVPDQLYYCIQLHMVQLWGVNYCNGSGTFAHSGDSVHIVIRQRKISDVAVYGMNDTIQHFAIEQLSSQKMVLQSSYASLSFRKF
jgi:hypothetical protein